MDRGAHRCVPASPFFDRGFVRQPPRWPKQQKRIPRVLRVRGKGPSNDFRATYGKQGRRMARCIGCRIRDAIGKRVINVNRVRSVRIVDRCPAQSSRRLELLRSLYPRSRSIECQKFQRNYTTRSSFLRLVEYRFTENASRTRCSFSCSLNLTDASPCTIKRAPLRVPVFPF